jgi:hypothetical protein
MSGMPAAVRITLWFDPDPQAKSTSGQTRTNPPMTFQTVARLMLAQNSSGDSSGAGSSDQSNQGAPTGGVTQ